MSLRQFLKGIADAIRGKEGSTDTIPAANFAIRISNLPSGEDEIDGLVEGTLTEFVNNRVIQIREFLFGDETENTRLQKVSCGNVTKIENKAFMNCTSLYSVYLPKASSIGFDAFSGCLMLKTIIIPSVVILYPYAFAHCSGLGTLDFREPCGMHAEALFGSGVSQLILRNESEISDIVSSALSATPIAQGNGYIYVPRSLVDAYKADTNWSTYANQFRALEDYTIDGTTTGELDPSKI